VCVCGLSSGGSGSSWRICTWFCNFSLQKQRRLQPGQICLCDNIWVKAFEVEISGSVFLHEAAVGTSWSG
jgi:hypothetical protein